MTNADITLRQMGGSRRLSAMIGAKDFFSDNDGRTLVFKFKACRKANCIKITLNAADTYDIEFIKIGRMNRKTFTMPAPKTVKTFDGVYCDQLHEVFEGFTGLYLSI